MTAEHGYGRYTSGCRCDVCRAAKAAYTRAYRQAARAKREAARAKGREYIAAGITHGRGGYQVHCCRCFTCKLANAESTAKYREARAGGAR